MASVITRTYEKIRGVDFSREPRNVITTRSPDMKNMWIDYNNDEEAVVTREGINLTKSFSEAIDKVNSTYIGLKSSKKVHGIHEYKLDSGSILYVYHVGKCLFWINGDSIALADYNIGENNSQSFMDSGYLYIYTGAYIVRLKYSDSSIKVRRFYSGAYLDYRTEIKKIDNTTSDSDVDIPFTPITTMSRIPTGGGDTYQQVNLLTPYRKNAFIGDSSSVTYYLDSQNIDVSMSNLVYSLKVWINDTYIDVTNGTEITYQYQKDGSSEIIKETKTFKVTSVDSVNGTITFNEAPPKPLTLGESNVIIMFCSNISTWQTNLARINGCNMVTRFDNRIFITGNPTYKNALFHSELNDPEYIGDLNYYQDGADNEAITSMCVGGNILWVFKDGREGGNNLYYHYASTQTNTYTDSTGNSVTEQKKSYPMKTGKSSLGAIGFSCNFLDDVVFLTNQGIYGLSYSDLDDDIYSENFVCSRSKNINSKLLKQTYFGDAQVAEYKGYLCVLVEGVMYLADSRATFKQNSGYEYEWFFFDNIGIWEQTDNENDTWEFHPATYLKSSISNDEEILYFGTDNGEIGGFNGDYVLDNKTTPIESYITTKADNFDVINHLKTVNKKGGILKSKVIANSALCVYVRNNKKSAWSFVTQLSSGGFDFSTWDFNNLSFNTDNLPNYAVIKKKQKKFNEVQYKIIGQQINNRGSENEEIVYKPFGFYSLTLEATEGGYIKR